MPPLFPCTEVAGGSLSRMIIGTNRMLEWSHSISNQPQGAFSNK